MPAAQSQFPAFLLTVLIAITLSSLASSQCDASLSLSHLQAGSINFQQLASQNSGSSQGQTFNLRKYTHTFLSKFNGMPGVSIGKKIFYDLLAINNFQIINTELASFYIEISNKQVTKVNFLTLSYSSWVMFTVNFLAVDVVNALSQSSSQSLTIGQASQILRSSTYSTSNNIYSSTQTFEVLIGTKNQQFRQNSNQASRKTHGKVWLNGLLYQLPSTKTPSLDIKIEFVSLSDDSVTISVQGGTVSSAAKIWFSYVIIQQFQASPVSFSYLGGSISSSNLVSAHSYNLQQQGLYQTGYSLYGVSSFNVKNSNNAFISSVGSDLLVTLYSSHQLPELTFTYIALGKPLHNGISSVCSSSCMAQGYWYLNGTSCVSKCPQNTYASVMSQSRGVVCLECSANLNLVINSKGNGCECRSGYSKAGYSAGQQGYFACQIESSSASNINNTQIIGTFSSTAWSSSGTTTGSNGNYINTNFGSGQVVTIPGTTGTGTGSFQSPSTTPQENYGGSVIIIDNSYLSGQPQVVSQTFSYSPITQQRMSYCSSSIANSFWDGYKCSCKVGFRNISSSYVSGSSSSNYYNNNNVCVSINSNDQPNKNVSIRVYNNTVIPMPTPSTCPSPLYYWNGSSCICLPQYIQPNGVCSYPVVVQPTHCNGPNEEWKSSSSRCQCLDGYARRSPDGLCEYVYVSPPCGHGQIFNGRECVCQPYYVRVSSNTCQLSQTTCSQPNMINNGLGVCICKQGYFKTPENPNTCTNLAPCPDNSARNPSTSRCECLSSFYNISNYCSPCPYSNQIYQQTSKTCQTFCHGAYQFLNQSTNKCQCAENYALGRDATCQLCIGEGKVIKDNYCVRCPINQIYNYQAQRCECVTGYFLNNSGNCVKQCNDSYNQVYSVEKEKCLCRNGLGRYGQQKGCQICPQNYQINQVTQECVACGMNEEYDLGKGCTCKIGYIPTDFGVCYPCSQVSGAFQLPSGRCGRCPGDKIYDQALKRCTCPSGQILSSGSSSRCMSPCLTTQMLDHNSNKCYTCPINEIPSASNTSCVCKSSQYVRRDNGMCQLSCTGSYFPYKGVCATCPPNRYYNSQIKGCICQDGFYLDNNNVCQKLVNPNPTCPARQYYDSDFGCQQCGQFCLKCTNSSFCTACFQNSTLNSYQINNGICTQAAVCGDGYIASSSRQQCDDGNSRNNDGCSSTCIVETNFRCVGQPSICTRIGSGSFCSNGIIETGEQCDDTNLWNGDGCSSTCMIQSRYTCVGQPSRCTPVNPSYFCGNGIIQAQNNQACDDKNSNNGDGCSSTCRVENGYTCVGQPSLCTLIQPADQGLALVGQIRYNINNIFIVLRTTQKTFTFSSEAEMESFMRSSVTSQNSPTTYCLQRDGANERDLFDCLLIYSSGIPNHRFNVTFTFDQFVSQENRNYKGRIVVQVDPLSQQQSGIRSLRSLR